MLPEARAVAIGLGLDETTIRRLQTYGYLSRFALAEAEIRQRLYRAHVTYLLEEPGQKEPEAHLARRTVPALDWPTT